jgi:hypothetical protein
VLRAATCIHGLPQISLRFSFIYFILAFERPWDCFWLHIDSVAQLARSIGCDVRLAFCESPFFYRLRSASFVPFSFHFFNCRCLLGSEGFLGLPSVYGSVFPGPCAARFSSPQGSPYLQGGVLLLPSCCLSFPYRSASLCQRLNLCLQLFLLTPPAPGRCPATLGESPPAMAFFVTYRDFTILPFQVGMNGCHGSGMLQITAPWQPLCVQAVIGCAPHVLKHMLWVCTPALPILTPANGCGTLRMACFPLM